MKRYSIFIIVVLCLTTILQGQNVDLKDGLVAYYPFNGNANDESGNGHHGTVYGAVLTTDRFGNDNSAYYFDGNNDYIIANVKDWEANEYSISLWVNTNKLGQDEFSAIFNNNNNLSGATDNSLQIDVDGKNPGSYRVYFYSYKINFGTIKTEWVHLILLYDGQEAKTYVNGNFKNKIKIPKSKAGNIFRNYVFGRNRAANSYFCGAIDDIRIYNRALNEDEIQALYHENESQVKVTTPNNGVIWYQNSVQTITWEATGVNFVDIKYSTDNSQTWHTLVLNYPASKGQYRWLVPEVESDLCKIRITDVDNPQVYDKSDGLFTIKKASRSIRANKYSIDFANVAPGKHNSKVITLLNDGTMPINISQITVNDTTFLVNSSNFELAPGERKVITVNFYPEYDSFYSDTLVIYSDAQNAPELKIPLTGTTTNWMFCQIDSVGGLKPYPSGTIKIYYTTKNSNSQFIGTANWQYSIDGLHWIDISNLAIGNDEAHPAGSYYISWNTQYKLAYLYNQVHDSVYFRMQVTDGPNFSNMAYSLPFKVNNSHSPEVKIIKVTGYDTEPSGYIDIHVRATDPDGDNMEISEFAYRFVNSTQWRTVNLANLSNRSLTGNKEEVIKWNSYKSIPGKETSIQIRLKVSDGKFTSPQYAISDTFSIDNNLAPEVYKLNVSTVYDDHINFLVQIKDAENDPCNIRCQYSIDKGKSWHQASVNGDTINVKTNVDFFISWLSKKDLGEGFDNNNVYFKIVPRDNDLGKSKTKTNIDIDYNEPPAAQLYIIPGTITQDRPISYTLSDKENDPLSIKVYYKLYGSDTWIPATISGDITNITGYVGGQIKQFTWHVMKDVPNTRPEGTTVELKVVPYDNDEGTPGITPQPAKINTDLPTKMQASGSVGDSIISISFNEELEPSTVRTSNWKISNPYEIKNAYYGLISNDFNEGKLDDFTLNGAAKWDPAGYILLTSTNYWSSGSIFFNEKILIQKFNVNFDFYIGDGNGADGLTFCFVRGQSPSLLGVSGSGLGFNGLDGYAIFFDEYHSDRIGIRDPNKSNIYISNVSHPRLDNNGWFHCEIYFDNGKIEVYLSNNQASYSRTKVIDYKITNFVPEEMFIGFTAGTGGLHNKHIIDNFKISFTDSENLKTAILILNKKIENYNPIKINLNNIYDKYGHYVTNVTTTLIPDDGNKNPSIQLVKIAEEVNNDIKIYYKINDYENDATDLDCYYRIQGQNNRKMASVIGETKGITNFSGSIIWESAKDLPGKDVNAWFIIKPHNTDYDDQGQADSILIHVDNNQPPSATIAPLTELYFGDVPIKFSLSDAEKDTLKISLKYSLNGSQWEFGTIKGKTSGYTDSLYSGTVIWKSKSDLPETSDTVWVSIIPMDNDEGQPGKTTCVINNAGKVFAQVVDSFPSEVSGDIPIFYHIVDPTGQNQKVSLTCAYSVDNGKTWQSTDHISGNITNLDSSKYSGQLIWDSSQDLPGVDKTTIRFKVIPKTKVVGFTQPSVAFHLDNNEPPAIKTISLPTNIGGLVPITYQIIDAENDSIRLQLYYKINDLSWKLSDQFKQPVSASYNGTIFWKAYADLGYGDLNNLKIKLLPYDNDPGTVDSSNVFAAKIYAGDYDGDFRVNDMDDLTEFALGWRTQDLSKEIGPAKGNLPWLIPQKDGKFDFEDLAVFTQMWNWFYTNAAGAPHLAKISMDYFKKHSSEQPGLNIAMEHRHVDNHPDEIILRLSTENISDYVSFEVFANYDSALAQVEQAQSSFPIFEFSSRTNYHAGIMILDTTQLEGDEILTLPFKQKRGGELHLELGYRLFDIQGKEAASGYFEKTLEMQNIIPTEFSIKPAYPNPFNPDVTLAYQLPKAMNVEIVIYDILGRKVKTLQKGKQPAGYYKIKWNGKTEKGRASSGVYFVYFKANHYIRKQKIIMLK